MSTVNPSGEAEPPERTTSGPQASDAAEGEPLGQWTLPSAPEAPPAPPPLSQSNDGAFAAPGGPVTEEAEEWALPPGSDGVVAPPGTGFRPVDMAEAPPASPLPGVALDPSVAGTAAGAFAPSRYDMNMLVPDPPATPSVPNPPVAAPTPPSPPSEVGGGRWAAVPPPPPGA